MRAAVRYYSRSGNTKAVAEAIAEAAGVSAISVDASDAAITEPVDVLFIGGALYAYGLDSPHNSELMSYLAKLCRQNNIRLGTDSVFKWIEEFPDSNPLQPELF